MPMRKWACLVSLILAATSLSGETSQEKGRQLVRRCLDAVGGQKFLDMRDKVAHGRAYQFYESRLSGLAVVTIYTKYDRKPSSPEPGWIGVRERRDYGKNADYSFLFTGGKIWDITYRGARPFPETQVREYQERLRRDIFYILKYRVDEPGMIFEWGGNVSLTVYLNKFTHLPMREEYLRRDPRTREVSREVSNYSRYRNISGVQIACNTQVWRDDEKLAESFIEDLEINKNLDESLFTLKKGLKILPPDK
jgi:hypothetical protein